MITQAEERLQKAKEYKAKWYLENKERIQAANKQRYLDNKEITIRRAREWAIRNPEKMQASRDSWVANNPDKNREAKRAWIKNNPERMKELVSKWCAENPEKVAAWSHNRRVKLVNSPFPIEAWKKLLVLFDGHCPYCKTSGHKLTIDHLVPVSQGGTNDIWNLVPCCLSCNSSKCDEDFLQWFPRLLDRTGQPSVQ